MSIRVNRVPVEQKMRVGSDGEAYFLSELLTDDNGKCISPMAMSPVSSMVVCLEHWFGDGIGLGG